MEFEWDEAKSDACFHERGFDFAYVARAFFDPDRRIVADHRRAYGEDRFRMTGCIDGRVFVVVYTMRVSLSHHLSPQGQPARGTAP
jgi:uncharacterized DUF497 family protein